jgi:hypothetical protein
MKEKLDERLPEGNRFRHAPEEVARFLEKAAELHGGEYMESLKVNSAGRIISDSRYGDELPAFLAMALESPDGSEPAVEDIYQFLKAIGEFLPGYRISINEDRAAGLLEYRLEKSDKTQP